MGTTISSSVELEELESTDSDFSDQYMILTSCIIGTGTHSIIKKCLRISDNKGFAVKIVQKNELNKKQLLLLKDEINILKLLKIKNNNPNIINIENVFENDKKIKIIFELCQNENLLDKIYKSPNKRLNESKSAQIIYTITKTLKYLHSNNIVHRDLKPQNILFTKNDNILKIIDFGSSKYIQSMDDQKEGEETNNIDTFKMNTKVGTPYYVAPEIISNPNNYYNHKIDNWSLGIILYLMLSGFHPFSAENGMNILYKNIINGNYSFNASIWNDISYDAIDLIKQLLTIDINKRISCDQILRHKWILQHMPPNI